MGFPGFEPGASSVLSTSSTADCTLALHNLLNIWNAINNNCWRGILGPETRTWGFSLHWSVLPTAATSLPQILLPPLRKPTGLCRVPLPALWSGSLSRQRASPVVAWTSFPPSLEITSLPCLMSSVSKTTALCVLRVWFWLLWVGGRRANRSLSVSLGRKWEQSLCFAALCGVSSAFSEVPGKRLQKIKGDSGVRGWRVASWLAFYRT